MSIKLFGETITPGHFPDHTQNITLEDAPHSNWNGYVDIEWEYRNDEEMVTLYFLVQHIREHSNNARINLIMPYIPNARMDRVYDKSEVFTLKHFTKFINDLKFNKVFVLDAHSPVSLALIDRVVQQPVEDYISKAILVESPDVVFMPDEGAHKRYTSILKNIPAASNIPTTFGIKHRDWKTGDILDYEIAESEYVIDKHVLIVDDISSKGGTFYFAAKALLKAGAKSVSLYITHCEETIKDGELFKENSPITNIYTANPLFDKTMIKYVNFYDIKW